MPGDSSSVPATFGGYERGRELGRGAFAVVFECCSSDSGSRFAAKAIDLRRLRLSVNVAREVKKLRREANVLKKVPPHPNLVRFIDVVQEGQWLFFLLELVVGGNLFNALVNRPGKRPRLRESEVRYIFGQLISGLALLHSEGIIHRDLKLENVLVVREQRVGQDTLLDVKIADFGLSKVVGDGLSTAISTVGSPRYMAPEVVAKGAHDLRADLWSLGVLVYVLLDGRFPCDGASAKVQQPKLDAAVAKLAISQQAQAAVLGLLQLKPEQRFTMDQLRQEPWLAKGVVPGKPRPCAAGAGGQGGGVAKAASVRGASLMCRSSSAAARAAEQPSKRARLSNLSAGGQLATCCSTIAELSKDAACPCDGPLFGPQDDDAVSCAVAEVEHAVSGR